MLVCNSFDLWQKDVFFSAAEEVQQSTDIMESNYRRWIKEKKDNKCLNELNRELQMSFSTAKWQLEEFERAVKSSYKSRGDEVTMTRHKQFVSVIKNQIFHVETALKKAINTEKKQSCLEKKEYDEFALFLSATPRKNFDVQIVIESKDKPINSIQYKDHPQSMRINWVNQFMGRFGGSQRQIRIYPYGYTIRFMLLFMLTIFLVVPFLFVQLRSK